MSFVRFGLIVTGEAEARFLPKLFKALARRAPCHFEVIRRIGQRTPRGSRRRLAMVGSGKLVADRDMTDFGLPARSYLDRHGEHAHVLLVDDLEWDRKDAHAEVFQRYRSTLDAALLDPGKRRRAGVFFLVMMLEAYGGRIIERLDAEELLASPHRCAALRTLFAWCVHALGVQLRFDLLDGVLCPVTRVQLSG